MSLRLAVFDCDGTLVDGQASVCDAMEHAFAAMNLPAPDRGEVRRIIGLSLPQAVRQLAPGASSLQCDQTASAFKHAFRTARKEGRVAEPLYDGIPDLLRNLHSAGWALGVATGKSDLGLANCLAVHGIADLFTTLQTADRHPSKPHPAMLEAALSDALAEPEHTVMIGDTAYDIEMATSIGIRALGVAWGYHSGEELLAAGAEAVAENPLELEKMLK